MCRKRTFILWGNSGISVSLIVNHDARPTEVSGMFRVGNDTSSILAHTGMRVVRSNNFSPVSFHSFPKEWLRVCNNRSTIWSDIIVINPGLWMNEIIIGSKMEKEGFVEGRECETKRVVVSEGIRAGRGEVSTMGVRNKGYRIS